MAYKTLYNQNPTRNRGVVAAYSNGGKVAHLKKGQNLIKALIEPNANLNKDMVHVHQAAPEPNESALLTYYS